MAAASHMHASAAHMHVCLAIARDPEYAVTVPADAGNVNAHALAAQRW